MHPSATVSVIIPCFDQGAFVAEAIASARAQDPVSVEVVAVDDGSTDATARVLDQHRGVRVVRRQRVGVSAARNAGLQASTGAFVAFLDADDRLLPGALATNLQLLAAEPACAFAAGHHRRIDERGAALPGPPPRACAGDAYAQLLGGNFVHTAAVLYRRAPLEAAGGFDPRLDVCEDWDLYLRLARAHAVRVHERVVSEYRRHGAQTTARAPERLLAAGLALLRAQRPRLRGDAEHAAWRAGLRQWRDHYVDELVLAACADLRARHWRRAAARTVLLARHAPTSVRRVVQALVRRARR
jgi:glycosyltransferase involved in cell wall biosynthesis